MWWEDTPLSLSGAMLDALQFKTTTWAVVLRSGGYQDSQMPEGCSKLVLLKGGKTTGKKWLRNAGHLQWTAPSTNTHLISRDAALEETSWVLKTLIARTMLYSSEVRDLVAAVLTTHWKSVPEWASLITENPFWFFRMYLCSYLSPMFFRKLTF